MLIFVDSLFFFSDCGVERPHMSFCCFFLCWMLQAQDIFSICYAYVALLFALPSSQSFQRQC